MWPFSRYPNLLARGEAFIKRWGVLAIFIGRFSGPLRASVPPRGRRVGHALPMVSVSKHQFRFCMGCGPSEARRRWCRDFHEDLERRGGQALDVSCPSYY
jgi:hypothetical protein